MCEPPTVNFYRTKQWEIGDFSEFATTPSTDPNAARCAGPGYWIGGTNADCPNGWTY